ncbi:MAG: CtsR family transcriptional regulator [Candidatus Syntrophonatronum acetioxidans]|uniref:CtsR family transcriptional regulator n=1 Tax=Candidatus Syntrophonatronum acetioxidans TaxID=1795816 RepID=A0A424YIE9_9FIRM|nr:MAG: CtsR family transcriptional regulator [Candidatus Syntrophonatronum acetioxidans]
MADSIELYLKQLLELSTREYILIQRGDLAVKFNCVPSQINYVLSTRFTPEKGFLVESRRGGGGYIRIIKIKGFKSRDLSVIIKDLRDKELSKEQAADIIYSLYQEKIITRREAKIMEGAVEMVDSLSSQLPSGKGKEVNKELLLTMLEAILKDK